MELWTLWLDAVRSLLQILSANMGLGWGLGIIALTLMFRTAALPISWSNAYRACIRQRKMLRLQPELKRLREQFASQPQLLMEKSMALYRKHGIAPIDGRSMLASVAQMPVFLGMFQVLRDDAVGARFLWVQNLSRPDLWLAILAGLTTALMMAVNPDLPANLRVVMIVIPSVFAVFFALKFCSALAVYWTASNCFSAAQTSALHWVIARRLKSGALKI